MLRPESVRLLFKCCLVLFVLSFISKNEIAQLSASWGQIAPPLNTLTGKNSLDFTSILIPEEMLLVAMVTE